MKAKPIAIINTIFFSSYCISVYAASIFKYTVCTKQYCFSVKTRTREADYGEKWLHGINMVSRMHNNIIILSSTNYSSHTGIDDAAILLFQICIVWKDWCVNNGETEHRRVSLSFRNYQFSCISLCWCSHIHSPGTTH